MLARRVSRCNARNHTRARVSYKGIFEHHRELALPKWNVHRVSIKTSNAFLQRQQTSIDLGSFPSPAFVVVLGVACSLTSSKINKAKPPSKFWTASTFAWLIDIGSWQLVPVYACHRLGSYSVTVSSCAPPAAPRGRRRGGGGGGRPRRISI